MVVLFILEVLLKGFKGLCIYIFYNLSDLNSYETKYFPVSAMEN